MVAIAHISPSGRTEQPLRAHLRAVAAYCGHFASAADLTTCGLLLGLLHDLGKYSAAFQTYIRKKSADAEALESDDSNPVPADVHRLNHSAAGAQRLIELLRDSLPSQAVHYSLPLFDLLASAILSHHNPGGLVDFISADGQKEPFATRLTRDHGYTYLPEVRDRLLIHHKQIMRACVELANISQKIKTAANQNVCEKLLQHLLLGKFLYSCLIDADRTDSADFEHSGNKKRRTLRAPVDWASLHARFERRYRDKFGAASGGDNRIMLTRRAISEACLARGRKTPPGIYRLPVPTGGGKTLASLRFALAHAASRQETTAPVRHIIYVLPFTTILIQNASEARDFIGSDNVLEHHANLLPSQIDRRQLLLSENWDAPVIFTTTVQFLNAFYSDSKEAQRRMHQAASSVLIFDEAQALPIKTLHLFNQALSFLTRQTSATALMCTATQPLLDEIDPVYGRLMFSPDANLTDGISFDVLANRTRLVDKRRTDGTDWSCGELVLALEEPLTARKHTLVIVNTKARAQQLFDECEQRFKECAVEVTHLSNNLCPAHLRNAISRFHLDRRRKNDKSAALLCISTSLVEAGVDLDFDLVVRDFAGFVSLIQAAGRCNRHGRRAAADFWVVNLERGSGRPGLQDEIDASARVLREIDASTSMEKATSLYFKYFYHEKKEQMLYPLQTTTLINLLTHNADAVEELKRRNGRFSAATRLSAAPESAARHFEVIDSATQGVIVPYTEEGAKIINDFCSAFKNADGTIGDANKLLARARPYTVNLYDNDFRMLLDTGAAHEVQAGAGVFYLDASNYHPEKGVTVERCCDMKCQNC